MIPEILLNKVVLLDVFEMLSILPDKSIDLVYTDPPYEFISKNPTGGGFMSKENKRHLEAINDSFGMTYDPKKFLSEVKRICPFFNGYFWTNKNLLRYYIEFAEDNKYKWDIILWKKTNPVPTFNGHYITDKEYCVFIRQTGSYFYSKLGYERYKTVFDYAIGSKSTKHPTEKPRIFSDNAIQVSCPEGGIVFDGYVGSGQTALSAREYGRNFVACDNNKQWVDIANERLLALRPGTVSRLSEMNVSECGSGVIQGIASSPLPSAANENTPRHAEPAPGFYIPEKRPT